MLKTKGRFVGFCWMSVLLLIGVSIISLSGCRQKPPIPKEGDVVIWKHSSELIIKAKLGQRREHVIAYPGIDHLSYEPEYERFIGQFPIDYDPKAFPKFTEAERRDFIADHDSKIHAVKSIHPLEFNLMLNGVTAKATDDSPYGGEGMDDPNQVKVILGRPGILENPPYNSKQFFELELMKELDISSKKTEHGLDCYSFKDGHEGKRCFGNSTYSSISGFNLYISPFDASPGTKNTLYANSQETIYGGIKIEWFTHQKNINRARDIDAAIWRLLEAWNVAPTQTKN